MRGFVAAVVVATAFATLIAYRHLVPKTSPRMLSLEHEIRRELARAERINLRTGVTYEEGIVISNTGSQPGPIATFSENFGPEFGPAPASFDYSTQLSRSAPHRTTVLNL